MPLLIPFATAVLWLLAWRRAGAARPRSPAPCACSAPALALLVFVSRDGIFAEQAGAWPAPFGITLVADLLVALMVVLAGVVGLAVVLFSLADIDSERERSATTRWSTPCCWASAGPS